MWGGTPRGRWAGEGPRGRGRGRGAVEIVSGGVGHGDRAGGFKCVVGMGVLVWSTASVGVEVGKGRRCGGRGWRRQLGGAEGAAGAGGGAGWDHRFTGGGGCEVRPKRAERPDLRKPQVQGAGLGRPAAVGGGAPSGCRSGSGAPGKKRAKGEWSREKGKPPSPLSREFEWKQELWAL